ncbi:MAG: quinone-dependent dihydroorotate dehydrogenase [Candidatus Binataceae bacterium]
MTALAQAVYARLMRPLLFRVDPETAHRVTLALLRAAPLGRATADPPQLKSTVFGVEFSNPVGLAAGLDKDALVPGAWQSLGFGFVELGTVTPLAQPGNAQPRIFRLPEHRALINRLGFPSAGMEAFARRLERFRPRRGAMQIAVNFGPNKDTPPDRVADDYAKLMARLGALADFVVVNVSSPNTPGLRSFQAPERLREIVGAMRAVVAEAARCPPLLVKIAPDLDREQLAAVCDAAVGLELAGIVACNTTIAHEQLGVKSSIDGGLSGHPLLRRAREVIRRAYDLAHGRLAIVGVGGIASADDAYAHIRAGASLVELYTGLIYEGPALVGEIKTGLARLLKRDGFRSISEAVGSAD